MKLLKYTNFLFILIWVLFFGTNSAQALTFARIGSVYPYNEAFYDHYYDQSTGTLYAGTYNPTAGAMCLGWVPFDSSVFTAGKTLNKDNGLGLDTDIPAIWDMAMYNEQLRVGVGNNGAAQVWTYDNYNSADDWTPMSSTGFAVDDTIVRSLHVADNGVLYAGTGNLASGAHIYWFNINTNAWVNSGSGGDFPATTRDITSIIEYNSHIYAGVWDATGANVYLYDGGAATWTPVSTGEFTASDTYIGGMAVFQGKLYVVTSGFLGSGDFLELYSYDGSNWTKIVGDATTPSRGLGGDNLSIALENYGNTVLYLGTINTTTGGQLWSSTNGTTWTQEVDDGFGDPANYAITALEIVNMSDGSVRLAAGTYNDSGAVGYWTETVAAPMTVLPKTGHFNWLLLGCIGLVSLMGIVLLPKWKIGFQAKK